MAIKIFTTGGTLDKQYNELNGQLDIRDSAIHDLLQKGRSKVKVNISRIMMIDSLHMTTSDRDLIAMECNRVVEDRILITHGTDTMVETAKHLAQKVNGKTVVLTGAMIPYTFGSSDGLFNIGCALAFVQCLAPGVFVAMNGLCFDWHNVYKDKQVGEFRASK